MSRYSRQEMLPAIGSAGQAKLLEARVTVVGCGALGTLASELLVRAGVGTVHIIDRDVVDLSNLQRQTLFTEEDARQRVAKAEAAVSRLSGINSEVVTLGYAIELAPSNARRLLAGSDVVLDATDNYATRFLINEACLQLKIPWVYGGAVATLGVVANFTPGGACFRCLFNEPPSVGVGESCDVAGVLGPATAMVASLQAAEAIKMMVEPASVRQDLCEFDLWKNRFENIPLVKDPDCPACNGGERPYLEGRCWEDVVVACGSESVMVRGSKSVDLALLANVLTSRGLSVVASRFRLRVTDREGREMVVFADGRTLITGTTDYSFAKRYYNSLMG